MILPLSSIANNKENLKSENNVLNDSKKIFFNCYTEITYYDIYESVGIYSTYGIGLWFLDSDDAEIKIYKEKNGDLLWQNEGIYNLRIFLFIGHTYIDEISSKTYGKALLLRINEE
jgi:hypothetical protein